MSSKRFSIHALTRRFKSTSSLKGDKLTPKLGIIAEAHKTTTTIVEATTTQESAKSDDSQEITFAKPEVLHKKEVSPPTEEVNPVVIDLTQPTPQFALDAPRTLAEPLPSIIVEEDVVALTPPPDACSQDQSEEPVATETTQNRDDPQQRTSQGSAASTVVEEPREADTVSTGVESATEIFEPRNTVAAAEVAEDIPSPTAVKFLLCVCERTTLLHCTTCARRCSSCVSRNGDTFICNDCESKPSLAHSELSGPAARNSSELRASAQSVKSQASRDAADLQNAPTKNSGVDEKVDEIDRKLILLSEKVSRVEGSLVKLEATLERALAKLGSGAFA